MTAELVVVGISHKTAPVGLLERFAIGAEQLPKALDGLASQPHVIEGAILSTCNRTEVYAYVSRFHAGVQALRTFLSEFCHVAPEDFIDHLYDFHADAAVRHLMLVASGVDSLVVGESEILGQVRRAVAEARDAGVARRPTIALFEAAARAGKRARTETAIGRHPASVSTAAVALARSLFVDETLHGRTVLLVGAGEAGTHAATALAGSGARIVLTNRTEERGRAIAGAIGAAYRPPGELLGAMQDADVVICATTAPGFVLDVQTVAAAVAGRGGHQPLLIIDIAVPRDVDPAVATMDGVVLRDIDDLRTVVQESVAERLRQTPRVEDIIDQELERFVQSQRALDGRALAAEIVREVDCIRRKELERFEAALPGLSAPARREIERLTKRLVAKAVHEPLAAARFLGPPDEGVAGYVAMLAELYGIDPTGAGTEDEAEDAG